MSGRTKRFDIWDKTGAHGRITIHCENKNSLQNLKKFKEMGGKYEVKVGNLSKLTIKVINISAADLTRSAEFYYFRYILF